VNRNEAIGPDQLRQGTPARHVQDRRLMISSSRWKRWQSSPTLSMQGFGKLCLGRFVLVLKVHERVPGSA
jgi:hypothetical protein